ncbi:MAG: phenylalanine--tRNA ligase subunit alpha [Oscillospiraceae bacterium]|nr:phenylalanine--tRNA ligase subunit alpha [Oscillospiraceae bacterium]
MKEQLIELKSRALAAIEAAQDVKSLEDVKVVYLGKKGELTSVLKQMGKLTAEERPVMGALANEVRERFESEYNTKVSALKNAEILTRMANEKIDITLPGKRRRMGSRHPLNIVLDELKEIFTSMGYTMVYGPEVEKTRYVFDMLETHEGHPARDEQDTFYIDDETILRTQTSSVQIRTMLDAVKNNALPLAIISPGRVYRCDEVDATHSPIFHQCEGLVINKNITFADLKGTLEVFFKRLYGDSIQLRFRPHHFPYTEPSAEVDLSCFKCGGGGCPFCKGEGWIEMLGCGMVHPQVLRNCGIDPDEYTGFAFGMGIERITLMRYEIDDMRLLYENDMRFLKQF